MWTVGAADAAEKAGGSAAGSTSERAVAGCLVSTDRRQIAIGRNCQPQELAHDAKDELKTIGYFQLAMQALDVRVDGSGRDAKVGGDRRFLAVVERGARDLQLARRQMEAAPNFPPGEIGEHCGSKGMRGVRPVDTLFGARGDITCV
jgi:hypothetical protein